jgi:hypothetical protein
MYVFVMVKLTIDLLEIRSSTMERRYSCKAGNLDALYLFVMILIPFSEMSNFDISDSSIKLRAEILCICSTTHTIHRGNNKVFRTTPDIPLSPAYSYE